MKLNSTFIHNYKDYAETYHYVVVRWVDNGYWFWGAYDDSTKAYDAAREITGKVVTQDPKAVRSERHLQDMSLDEIKARIQELESNMFYESMADFMDWESYRAWRSECDMLQKYLRESEAA